MTEDILNGQPTLDALLCVKVNLEYESEEGFVTTHYLLETEKRVLSKDLETIEKRKFALEKSHISLTIERRTATSTKKDLVYQGSRFKMF